jgi:hypothetical protein
MRNFIDAVIAATMTSLFAVMFWGQVGGVATAFARTKTETLAVTSNTLPIRPQPVY